MTGTNLTGVIVGAVVARPDGSLVMVNVAGLDTPPATPPAPKPLPPKATVPAFWVKGRMVNYRSKGSGVVRRYAVFAIRNDRTAVKIGYGSGRYAKTWWADASEVWD